MARKTRKRKSLEAGHKRKFLVLVDASPECERALHYACRRVQHTGGGLMLLRVISSADFQHWLGVENIMREEATEEAKETLKRLGVEVHDQYDLTPELAIREGDKAEQIVQLIEEDEDIAILVLGAADDPEGPGPLVSMVAGDGAGRFSIPVTIVPGDLTDELIDALA
jgi:nucleotide-binding universal stress UspA family protein